jgi:RHS repeat-associated protein
MSYDAAGNLTNDTYTGAGNRTYDGENKITSAWGGNNQAQLYVYDASGQRIKRTVNGVETWQVYGLGGELLAEYPANGAAASPQKEYGYRNGQLLITAEPPVNVALAANGGVASASSSYVCCGWNLTPAGANNGNRSGAGWGSNEGWNDTDPGNTFPDWLQVDFSGSKTINEIDVFTIQDNWQNPSTPTESMTFSVFGLTGFDVQYWNGSAWTTVPGGSVTGNSKVWRKFTFTPITTTKIRVLTNASVDGYSRITELEAWQNGSAGTVHWLVTDQLGTPRIILDQTGALANVKRHDYLPFGEELFAPTSGRSTAEGYASGDGVRQHFTQKERDIETGLDYFNERYYTSTQGRFISADEFTGGPDEYYDFSDLAADNPMFYADLTDPQSLNKYQYAYNNPLLYIDPDGHQGVREFARWAWSEASSTVQSAKQNAKETFNGAVSAFAEDNGAGPLDTKQNRVGRAIGHGVAIVQSGAEIVDGVSAINAGGGEAVVTAPACATGVGCVAPAIGAGAVVGGVVLTIHGAAVAVNTLNNIFNGNTSAQQPSSSGQTSAGRPTDQRGRPLGPSGKPMIHQKNFPTKTAAKDAARNAGNGAPMKHPSPRRGDQHFHPTRNGKKIADGTHYNYPR